MNANQMQAMIDGMSAQWMRERAETQMTLGKLIDALRVMPPEAEIERIKAPHSYRDYYSDLAFEPRQGRILASELLAICESAMGQVFEGYKGGDYVMSAIPEGQAVLAYGGHAIAIDFQHDRSTTRLLSKVRGSAGADTANQNQNQQTQQDKAGKS